jgi:hypothetical protein
MHSSSIFKVKQWNFEPYPLGGSADAAKKCLKMSENGAFFFLIFASEYLGK